MIANCSKRVFNPVHECRAYFSSKKGKPLSHYDTLKVTRNSTQDDIKSAYYELSKKYHPDINKSSDAKRIFQEVSDAYEVLGNFSKRKLYDRNLSARGVVEHQAQTFTDVEDDVLSGFYKSRQTQGDYNPDKESTAGPARFDFDGWTRAHYGTTLRRSLKDKSGKILREKLKIEYQKEREKNKATNITVLSAIMVILASLTIYTHYVTNSLDRNLIPKKKK